jgi:hypothetical protein
VSLPLRGQVEISLESVTAFGNYLYVSQKDSGISSAYGPGGGLEVRFHLSDMFSVGIMGGYSVVHIDQDNVIDRWNWEYWIRYYKNWIISVMGTDSLYLNGALIPTRNISSSTLTSGTLVGKDNIYKAEITPRQYVNLFPVILSLNANFAPADFLKLYASVGAGLYIFERNMYLDEKWWKNFPTVGYTFQYGFKDYANEKTGTLWGIVLSAGGRVALTESFALSAAAEFHSMLNDKPEFPMNSIVNVRAGIAFVY